MPKVELAGRTFGKWKVIERASAGARGRPVKWLCQCECGFEKKLASGSLISGKSTQCRACGTMKAVIHGAYWHRIRYQARRRGIPFEVTKEEAREVFDRQGGLCALSGKEIHFARTNKCYKRRGEATASLDRKDSSRGYTKDNIQWLHTSVNLMKMNLGEDEFIQLCQLIAARSAGIPSVATAATSDATMPSDTTPVVAA